VNRRTTVRGSRLATRVVVAVGTAAALAFVCAAAPAQTSRLPITEEARIGVTQGDPDYQFSEVNSALLLPGDTAVVADRAEETLRFFDPRGRLVRTVGGPGEGPGEFRALVGISLWKDSIFAYDFLMARISVFDAAGSLRRTFSIRFDDDGPLQRVLGVIEPGLVIGEVGTPVFGETASGIRRDSFTVAAFDQTGRRIRRIGRFNGNEQLVLITASANGTRVIKSSLPNGHMTFRRVSDTKLVVSETDRLAVVEYDSRGDRAGGFTKPHEPVPLNRAEKDDMHRALTAWPDPDQWRSAERALRSVRLPETRPAFANIAVAHDGRVLMREVTDIDDTEAQWSMYSETGRPMGTFLLPTAARILDVRGTAIIAVESDDVGVPQVVRYRMGS